MSTLINFKMNHYQKLGDYFPEDKILITQLGAALGVHGGPGVLLVAFRLAA